jgi:hypothetical protein
LAGDRGRVDLWHRHVGADDDAVQAVGPAFSVSPMMCSALQATLSLALEVGRGRVLRERVLGCSGAASMCCKQAALRENG